MRIHTDRLKSSDFYSAALIARVDMDLTRHGSRSRARAFNVLLRGESRRRPNLGTSRNREWGSDYAATWDQWGVFLAVLFEADDARTFEPSRPMVTPYYATAEEFAAATGDRFGAPEDVMENHGYQRVFKSYGWPEDAHGDHVFRFDGTPYEQVCKAKGVTCSAVQRWGARAQEYVG